MEEHYSMHFSMVKQSVGDPRMGEEGGGGSAIKRGAAMGRDGEGGGAGIYVNAKHLNYYHNPKHVIW